MKYGIMYLIYTAVCLPLISISWFTWPALFSVSGILTLYYWVQESHAENTYNSTLAQTKRLDLIKDRIEKLTDFIQHGLSDSDAVNDKILSELRKIRKTVRHEVKDL